MGLKVAVVIPSYRGENGLLEMVAGLLALDLPLHVVIVEDASARQAADAATALAGTIQRITVVPRKDSGGPHDSLMAGLEWCRANGFDSVCTIDGDWSQASDAPPSLIAAANLGLSAALPSRADAL